MPKISYTFAFIKHIVTTLIIDGILIFGTGTLILVFPNLLPYLVAFLLIIIGISFWIAAAKVNKYSKVELKL